MNQYLKVVKSDIKNKVIGSEVTSDSDKIPANIKTFNQMVFYVNRYKKLKEKESDEDKKLSDKEKEEIKHFEEAINKNAFKSIYDVEIYHNHIPESLIGSGTLQNPADKSAKYYDDQISEIFDDDDSDMLEELKKFTLSDKFFKDILEGNDHIYDQIRLDKELPDSGKDLSDPGKYTIGQLYGLFYYAMSMKSKKAGEIIIQSIENKLGDLKKKQVKTIEGHMSDYDKAKKELENVDTKKEEDKADKSFGELWAELNKYKDIKDSITSDNATYAELDGYIKQYNGAVEGAGDASEPESRLQFIKDAFNRFKEFVEFIQGFPNSIRNELYINEYILANYGTKAPYELGKESSYYYNTKKAQYITYGYNTAGINYFMFLKDVVMILFVVNMLAQITQGGICRATSIF
ncbi:hypothetical protein RWE15_12670 [Virgibacillus halophilus]|uniref:LXG domain of WXG superfamily protein n=1 Tax=Tigheibacillus halophilus TaxID=361280 RepID=A0ABU5C741_9BACI|nr:hypothetical protein [Virgibacillus halophilus]